MGVMSGACAWFRLVFEHASFSTIGETSTSVSLGDTRTGQPKDADPGSAGAGTE